MNDNFERWKSACNTCPNYIKRKHYCVLFKIFIIPKWGEACNNCPDNEYGKVKK